MKSWRRPEVPQLPGTGPAPRLYDTAAGGIRTPIPAPLAALYVCGITPYDATHLGHAASYLAYDTLVRLWLDAGYEVQYVQNVTDIDEPLLERAEATGVDWRELGQSDIERFRRDMELLGVIPPNHYVAVTEVIEPIAQAVRRLLDAGVAYRAAGNVYFDSASAGASPWYLGQVSGLDRDTMRALSAERGGDPDTPGKRDPLDPVLWRGERPGEPSWPGAAGPGRPGWHIECSVIAQRLLALPLTVTGGGRDLAFPHHEFTAAHTAALTGHEHSRLYSHAGLVAYRGEKMSKSLGNLVFVATLVEGGVDPRAIRLAVLTQHYRDDWEWTDARLTTAQQRLEAWQRWATRRAVGDDALLGLLRTELADDLGTPAAVARIDARVAAGIPPSPVELAAIDALLGIAL